MSKSVYIGVSSTARKVKKIYIGVSNVARKVKKGYIGVNGVAKQFFASSAPPSRDRYVEGPSTAGAVPRLSAILSDYILYESNVSNARCNLNSSFTFSYSPSDWYGSVTSTSLLSANKVYFSNGSRKYLVDSSLTSTRLSGINMEITQCVVCGNYIVTGCADPETYGEVVRICYSINSSGTVSNMGEVLSAYYHHACCARATIGDYGLFCGAGSSGGASSNGLVEGFDGSLTKLGTITALGDNSEYHSYDIGNNSYAIVITGNVMDSYNTSLSKTRTVLSQGYIANASCGNIGTYAIISGGHGNGWTPIYTTSYCIDNNLVMSVMDDLTFITGYMGTPMVNCYKFQNKLVVPTNGVVNTNTFGIELYNIND